MWSQKFTKLLSSPLHANLRDPVPHYTSSPCSNTFPLYECRQFEYGHFSKRSILKMKRQRSVDSAAIFEDTSRVMKKKKNNRAVENKVEEQLLKDGAEPSPAMATADNWLDWEEQPSLTREVFVDEQMSWSYFSLPIWGVEFMAEAYGSLFSDVVWDDDIWNLKSIKEIPSPPPIPVPEREVA